jgi:tyrosine-protein kinase Etk/Wzc
MATENDRPMSRPDDDIHLLDYLVVLAKHLRLIVFTTVGVTLLTLVILFCVSKKYTASTRILPPQQNMTLVGQLLDTLGGGTSPSSSSATSLGGGLASMLGLKSPGDLYVGFLTGDTISDRIIERFKLRKLYRPWYSILKAPPLEDIRAKLGKRTTIDVGKDGIISVQVTDEDPRQAAVMANAFPEELDKLLQQMSSKSARDQLAFLEKERAAASQNLAKAEEGLKHFSEQNNVLQIDAQTKSMLEYIAALRASIDAKEVQLKVLRQQATPLNYEVVRLETELRGLREKLSEAECQSGQTRLGDVCLTTSKVPSLGLEYVRLYRETKFQETLYRFYCKLVEMARVDEVRDTAVLQIVDQATPPEKKSSPKRFLITTLVGIATFFGMIFVSFTLEHWHNASSSEKDAIKIKQIREYTGQWRQDLLSLVSWLKRKKS